MLDVADDTTMSWNAHAGHAQVRDIAAYGTLLCTHCPDAQVIRDGVLCAGLYPQVATGAEVDGRTEWTVGSGRVAVHPSSVNHGLPNLVKVAPFLLFHEKLLTTQVFIRECSAVSPAVRGCASRLQTCVSEMHSLQGLLLLGGAVEVQYTQGTASVDGRIKLRVDAQTAVLVKTLRVALDEELSSRIADPASPANVPLLAVIVKLLNATKGREI